MRLAQNTIVVPALSAGAVPVVAEETTSYLPYLLIGGAALLLMMVKR